MVVIVNYPTLDEVETADKQQMLYHGSAKDADNDML